MKFRRSDTGRFITDGASRIVAAPSMEKTREAIRQGSMAGDWRAVGGDMRRSLTKAERLVG